MPYLDPEHLVAWSHEPITSPYFEPNESGAYPLIVLL